MAKNGNDIIIMAGGVAIAGTKSDQIQTSAETIETSSPSHGAWRTSITKRKEWKVSVGYLVLSSSALHEASTTGIQDLLKVGNTYTLAIKSRESGGDLGVTGDAILKKAEIRAQRGKLVTGSFDFEGNGELAAGTSGSLE